MSKVLSFVVAMTLLVSSASFAQTAPPPSGSATTTTAAPQPVDPSKMEGGAPRFIRPETPEQRMARLGTPTDPGADPDSTTIWWRFGKKYTIHKFEKQYAKYDQQEGWVRPWAPVNFAKEIYQENDKYVWVWNEERDPEPVQTEDTSKYREFPEQTVKYLESVRNEFSDLTPQDSNVKVRFEDASKGLPTDGSWRNTLAVADMNEDGKMDIVLPPQRGMAAGPSIYLGDGTGNWKFWDLDFPAALNYGSVVVADFNKDKHMDMAFGVHLTGVDVFYGDGKGKFTQAQIKADEFPTRRILAVDADKDGWTDVVAISEGPVARGPEGGGMPATYGRLRVYYNRAKGARWEGGDVSKAGEYLGGDWLASGNFNGDKYPDFIGASVYFNGTDILQLSSGPMKWTRGGDEKIIPLLSYYHGVTAGRFGNGKLDDAVIAYVRRWPPEMNPKIVPAPAAPLVTGMDRITFEGGTPKRTAIARWASNRGVLGLKTGDFNSDGKLDILYTRWDPREAVILLGDGNGNFSRAAVDGIKLRSTVNYDVEVADVNGDRKPDVVVMYESDEQTAFGNKNGSVQVFLNRGSERNVQN